MQPSRIAVLVGLTLGLLVPAGRAEDLVPDLSVVRGLDQLDADGNALALLRRNGFVVVPRGYHQIFSPYIQERLPVFVTTDSLLHTYHVIFEEGVRDLETRLAGEVGALSGILLSTLADSLAEGGELARDDREARHLALGCVAVAVGLLDPEVSLPAAVRKIAREEVRLVQEARGVAPSPLFKYEIDYSLCKPRGFYTDTRHFRCVSWYGRAAFRLVSDRETRAALALTEAFASSGKAREIWHRIDAAYGSLIGPCDDATLVEYSGLASELEVTSRQEDLGRFRERARSLHQPRISDLAIAPEDRHRWRELSQGLRILGPRYLPDGEVFLAVTATGGVEGRGFPSGLDLLAANGSERARHHLEAAGVSRIPGHAAGLREATGLLARIKSAADPGHYGRFLLLLEALTSSQVEAPLPFQRTPAWADRELNTALGSWASLRHTWQLQGKQSVEYMGLTDIVPGWVEQEPLFFERFRALIAHTFSLFEPLGLDVSRLSGLDGLVERLTAIAGKQIRGDALSEEDRQVLMGYGPTLAHLAGFGGNAYLSDERLPWMARVADVHCELASGLCLQVGIGPADSLYVVIPQGDELHLAVGGVYSYRELTRPLADRLTDGAWHKECAGGTIPAAPSWQSSFLARPDVDDLVGRLERGEKVDEILTIDDERFFSVLEKGVQSGGVFHGKKEHAWALEAYARKGRGRAVSLLIDLVRGGEKGSWMAARALSHAVGPEHLSLLARLLADEAIPNRHAFVGAVASLGDEAAERVLDLTLLHTDSADVRRSIVRCLQWQGSRASTPDLLQVFSEVDQSLRVMTLETLGEIWAPRASHHLARFPESLTADETTELRATVVEFLGEVVRSHEFREARMAIMIAGRMGLVTLLPEIEHRVMNAGHDVDSPVIWGISQFPAELSVPLLLKLSDRKGVDIVEVLSTLVRLGDRSCTGRIVSLLDDTTETDRNSCRVCDWAAITLKQIYPEGPQPNHYPSDRVDADRVIREWKDYLSGLEIEESGEGG